MSTSSAASANCALFTIQLPIKQLAGSVDDGLADAVEVALELQPHEDQRTDRNNENAHRFTWTVIDGPDLES